MPVKGLSRAVFLSYASQDARAAQRICAALRAAGVEVWMDKSELRGGDAWDRQIRERIRDSRLFIAVISAHTEARDEGYFRREWKLAVDRTRDMAENKAFIVPVVIDNTQERGAAVPDRFHEVQWTRLRAGRAGSEFATHIQQLLAQEPASAGSRALARPTAAATTAAPPAVLRRPQLTALALATVVLGCLATWALVEKPWHSTPIPPASQATSRPPTPVASLARTVEPSIAVLPFINMSADKTQDYFADGLAEELLDLLAKTPGLHVIARTSSFSFKGKSDDIPTIAAKLKVANILEGSVRRSGNRLRVTAQLIRADTSEHLWSDTFERELRDVFKVQDEIASAVVAALKVHLLPAQQNSLRSELHTSNLEAYDLYLQGRDSYNRGDSAGYHHAVTALRQATALDPRYAAAYAALALAEFWAEDAQQSSTAVFDSALASAEKAVALAPRDAAAYSARGFLRAIVRYDFAGAQADLTQAVALNSGDANVLHRAAVVLAVLGDLPAAIDREQQALALDPLSSEICMRLAFFYTHAGRWAEARPLYEKALAIAPNSVRAHYNLGDLELFENHAAAALAEYRKTEFESWKLIGQAKAEYSLGHAEASQKALDAVILGYESISSYQIAQVYAWRGETDKCFEWLERAAASRDDALTWLRIDRHFRSVRDDARYKSLLRKVGWPE